MFRSVSRLQLLGAIAITSWICLTALEARELASQASSAIDANGVRHLASQYHGKLPPWISDLDRFVGPEYSDRDRRLYNQGTGLFRLILNLKTGAVLNITIVRSAGTGTLDRSALVAMRQWRWKPGKWKEVNIPMTFRMASGSSRNLPPGAIRLPNR